MTRELEFEKTDLGTYAVFNSNGKRVKRLLMPHEFEKAKFLLELEDEYGIEIFCSSIV